MSCYTLFEQLGVSVGMYFVEWRMTLYKVLMMNEISCIPMKMREKEGFCFVVSSKMEVPLMVLMTFENSPFGFDKCSEK